MMGQDQQCVWMDQVVQMFNATLNVIQIVMVAYIAKRAVQKNGEEKAMKRAGKK